MATLESILSVTSPKPKCESALFLRHLGCSIDSSDDGLKNAQELWNELKRAAFCPRWLAPYRLALAQDWKNAADLRFLKKRYGLESERIGSASAPGQWDSLPMPRNPPTINCKLSIVAVSRNDNHGGHLQPRMQAFLDNLFRQSERYRCPIEIILVEWNPPPAEERFRDLLRYPKAAEYATLRIIEVPPCVHQRFHYAETQSLYQMIGKNAGIRRAMGEYVLCTNVDILFSDELFEFLATAAFDPEAIYRCDRHDAVQLTSYNGPETMNLLEYCEAHTVRRNTLKGTYTVDGSKVSVTYPESGDTSYLPFPMLHTNGCGDFQLMHRNQWYRLGGYAEFDCFSLHVDSVLQVTAYFAGIKEIRLQPPMVCFHIDHDSGWSPKSEAEGTLDASLKARKLPRLEFEWILELAHTMKSKGQAISLNQPDWGLAEVTLPAETISQTSNSQRLSATGKAYRARGIDYLQSQEQLIVTDHELPPERIWREFIRQHFIDLSGLIAKLSAGRKLLLWGASARGKLLLESLAISGTRPVGFIDTNPQLADTMAHGLPVYAPAAIADQIGDVFILIASMQSDEIRDKLDEFGFKRLKDYFDPIF